MGVSRKIECSAARERVYRQTLPRARLRMHLLIGSGKHL